MRILGAAAAYFAWVFGAGFMMGLIRVPFLAPRLGARAAELIEMPVMLCVIVLSARWIVKRFALLPQTRDCLVAGLIALTIAVTAELFLAMVLQHLTLAQYLSGRDPVSGGVFAAMLVLFGLMPAILARIDAVKSLILEH